MMLSGGVPQVVDSTACTVTGLPDVGTLQQEDVFTPFGCVSVTV
jgi:hypothetical protein